MKRIIIARHAKSDWSYPDLADIDRPLKDRGVRDAYTMAGRLKKLKVVPDLILSSPATRAIHTALIHARELDFNMNNLKIVPEIYHAGTDNLLRLIRTLDQAFHSAMIFGHNPAFTDLANHFLPTPVDNVPTSGLVILDFQATSWKEVDRQSLVADAFDYPKKHQG